VLLSASDSNGSLCCAACGSYSVFATQRAQITLSVTARCTHHVCRALVGRMQTELSNASTVSVLLYCGLLISSGLCGLHTVFSALNISKLHHNACYLSSSALKRGGCSLHSLTAAAGAQRCCNTAQQLRIQQCSQKMCRLVN
jgi:hypothetical protein